MKQNWLFLIAIVVLLVSGCASPAGTSTPLVTAQPAATTPPPPTSTQEKPAVAATQPATDVPTPASSPTPAEDVFQNPIMRANFPDPFVLKEGETYYAYATNGSGVNVQTATSTDLVHWQRGSDAMPTLASWVRKRQSDVWAPEVLKNGDQYLLYYTARDDKSGKQCVGVAISDQPQGKFRDAKDAPLVCQVNEGGTIDASPFRDGEKLYLLFKNDGNCCGIPTYIHAQEMTPDGLGLVGEPKHLVRNDEKWEAHVIEAPTMWLHDGQYFLFFSANDYGGPAYAVGYAVCQSVTGPCEDAPENPILSSQTKQKPLVIGPGHQTLIQVGDETWIMYHAWNMTSSGIRSNDRFVWLDRVEWIDGKPDVIGPTTGPQPEPEVEE